MSFVDKYSEWFRRIFPSPFTIAIILSIVTYFGALTWGGKAPNDQIMVKQTLKGYDLSFKSSTLTLNDVELKSPNSNLLTIKNGELFIPNDFPDDVVEFKHHSNRNDYVSSCKIILEKKNNHISSVIIEDTSKSRSLQLLDFWYSELWGKGGLAFAVQMMLMLLLGSVLAISKPVSKLLDRIVVLCVSNAHAVVYVVFFTVLVSLFNWGLGLIFGAILARKVGEHAVDNNIKINYPLIGAAGYTGLMVWHGGISGSALVKVSEPGHLASLVQNSETLKALPDVIPFSQTVFSSTNLIITFLLIIVLPLTGWLITKKTSAKSFDLIGHEFKTNFTLEKGYLGAEKLDHSKVFAYLFSFFILAYTIYLIISSSSILEFKFITPNFINFLLLGLALLFHGSIAHFLKAVDLSIKSVSGILIQFPLYFGIMGMMKHSGMIINIADFFSSISTSVTYPIYTFFSAGLVNIFVPSGGGQWYVQGPIVLQTAVDLGVSPSKSILALAYGDQITNMLQPFWALPLLGITGLKAKEILPYTILFMLSGCVIFLLGLLFF